MSRLTPLVLTRILVPLAVGGLAFAIPAYASVPEPLPARAPASPGYGLGALIPAVATGNGSVAPLAGDSPASPSAASAAAATCVAYAASAGWPDNGYYGGDLVTAAAICAAESAGNPKLYVCDHNGAAGASGNYPPVNCPTGTGDSYDRGLWQLNSVAAKSVSDTCAFDPVCNAGKAYLFSGRGTSFAPWASYDQDTYARPFLDLVQATVTKLGAGTVTSALLGECLAQARPVRGAEVVIVNCGNGAATQQWAIAGSRLKAGTLCATIARPSGSPKVVLSRCGRSRSQVWQPFGRDELRNAADGKCLTDPGSSLMAGTQVVATRCVNAKAQTWWLP